MIPAQTLTSTVPEGVSLGQAINAFVRDFERAFPNAILLLNGDAYGEADAMIDIYVPREEMDAASLKSAELAFEYDLKTLFFIVPIVLPLDACPAR
jgi:hypothetical protein